MTTLAVLGKSVEIRKGLHGITLKIPNISNVQYIAKRTLLNLRIAWNFFVSGLLSSVPGSQKILSKPQTGEGGVWILKSILFQALDGNLSSLILT